MNQVEIEEYRVCEYISDMLSEARLKISLIKDAKFHHTSRYSLMPTIIKHGILPLSELNRLNITSYSDEEMKRFSDTESHINGINGVSLSVRKLKNIDINKFIYDPLNPNTVDIRVDSNLKTDNSYIKVPYRSTAHYDNEFIFDDMISTDSFRSIDIRIFNLINQINRTSIFSPVDYNKLVENYNALKEIALEMVLLGKDIPLREMSFGEKCNLDPMVLMSKPKLKIRTRG